MSKKTIIRVISVALMVAMIALCFSNIALASGYDQSFDGQTGTTSTAIAKVLNIVLGIAQVVGVAIAVIMLIVLAIKYISAAPGDKAEIKKHAVVYIVGAVVLFAASGILQIIKNFAGEAF